MAIVKGSYTRSRGAAKANIGYITKRPGKDKEKITRTLFGLDGVMTSQEAYRMIDQAGEGSFFYRLVLSPDPIGEDTRQDLDMRALTLQTMQVLDAGLTKPSSGRERSMLTINPHRHVHILAVSPRRLTVRDFARLRLEATRESLQRRALDFDRKPQTRQRFTTYQTLKYHRTDRQSRHVARGGAQPTCTPAPVPAAALRTLSTVETAPISVPVA